MGLLLVFIQLLGYALGRTVRLALLGDSHALRWHISGRLQVLLSGQVNWVDLHGLVRTLPVVRLILNVVVLPFVISLMRHLNLTRRQLPPILRLSVCLGLVLGDAARLNDGGFRRERALRLNYQRRWLFDAADAFARLDLNVVFGDHDLLAGDHFVLVFWVDRSLLAGV